MNLEHILGEIGLSSGESKIYLSLLKLGQVPVSKLKEDSHLHRTTIYDFLEKLLNKGLVNYVVKNNVKFYGAAHPTKILELLKEREDLANTIMPQLLNLASFHKDEMKVEVYKGAEGVKTILNDVLKVGKDYVILGVDEIMFKEKLGSFMDNFFLKEKQIGFKERILTSNETSYIYENTNAIYRYLPKESFNPTPTYVWADNVGILIWEPFTVIKIKNAALADSYSKYFEMLWEIAEEKPKQIRF